MRKDRIESLKFLDIGCGLHGTSGFVNLDYWWRPEVEVCWDLTKDSLPFESNRFKGVFSEHCFEHVSLDTFRDSMRDVLRVLIPGGTARIVMPDGELYFDIYQDLKNGGSRVMPFIEEYITPMARINGLFRNHGHVFIYDFETVKHVMEEIGFCDIKKESFGKGREESLAKRDTDWRAIESLYVEGRKPS